MIDPKSLRIGNRINLYLGIDDNGANYRECVVKGISLEQPYSIDRIRIDNTNHWHSLGNFEGIPLSPSLLERAGFVASGIEYTHRGSGFQLYFDNECGYFYHITEGVLTYIREYHRLQNFFYAYFEEELELKP